MRDPVPGLQAFPNRLIRVRGVYIQGGLINGWNFTAANTGPIFRNGFILKRNISEILRCIKEMIFGTVKAVVKENEKDFWLRNVMQLCSIQIELLGFENTA